MPQPTILSFCMGQDDRHSFRVSGPPSPEPAGTDEYLYEFSVEQARTLDRRCVDEFGIPEIVLMENAAIGLSTWAMGMLGSEPDPSVVICCGPGNNGGDGLALGRHLHNRRVQVTLVLLGDGQAMQGSARTNLHITQQMGIKTLSAQDWLVDDEPGAPTLLVDALFGTGLGRAIEGAAGEVIDRINRLGSSGVGRSRVLSVDIPSGLGGDSGMPIGKHTIIADRTVTMAGLKPGLRMIDAQGFVGEVSVVPIGAPLELLDSIGRRVVPRTGAGD